MVCGYEPITLNRLHERTQTNRIRRFTVAPDYLVAGAPKYFPLGRSRALSSTARVGIFYEPYQLALVPGDRLELPTRRASTYRSTNWAIQAYKPDCVGIEPTLDAVEAPVHRTLSLHINSN